MALADLQDLLQQRIVFLDGALGTMFQMHELEEQDYQCEQTRHSAKPLKETWMFLRFPDRSWYALCTIAICRLEPTLSAPTPSQRPGYPRRIMIPGIWLMT